MITRAWRHGLLGVALIVTGVTVTSAVLLDARPVAADTFSETGFVAETVATVDPYTLVGLSFAPDGRMFVWQKDGVVRIVKNGVLLPTPFIDLSDHVNTFDDRGFWGLAFDPDYATNGFVYMSYTFEESGNPNSSGPKTARLTRVTSNPANRDVALPGETVIMGSVGTPPCSSHPAGADCLAADCGCHTIGEILFLPDGTMLVGNGDGADAAFADTLALRAQDLNSTSGKLLRINKDGTAPPDNPFYDGTNSVRSKVWLYGVRNPFRFALQPGGTDVWFGDVGWNTWEEVDRGVKGANYGWPCYEGAVVSGAYSSYSQCANLQPSAVTMPFHAYTHASTGSSVIGGPFYQGTSYPQQYRGNYFFADYTGNFIKRVVFDDNLNPISVQPFATNVQAPVSLAEGPDGMIYYLSFTTGQIRRIRPSGPSAVASATPMSGPSPLTVAFSSSGSTNPAGGALTYLWDFGDGTTSNQPNPTHTYTVTGTQTFVATLRVTDIAGMFATATVPVTLNSLPPTPTISLPIDGTSVEPGQTVTFQGSATDAEDGAIPPAALSWTVLLNHNTHVHTSVGGSGASGSFVVENHGPIGTFSYQVMLTATDSSGLTSTRSVNLPVIADTSPPTAPGGLAAAASGAGRINLSWTASTDDNAVSGYQVERCTGASCTNFVQVATPSETNLADTGLAASTAYRYRVRAVDVMNNVGPYSGLASATTSDAPPPPAGLVAGWSFDEGAGLSVGDVSGNTNTGTITGGTSWVPGKYGGALSFNGTTGRISVPASASLGLSSAMTLMAWVQPTANQSGWRTIMQRETDAYVLNASNDTGALRPSGGGTLGGSFQWTTSTTANPVNAWSHVALTYDGAILRLYVNGTQVATNAAAGTIQSSPDPLWIGGNSPYGEYFQGLIDEARVYNRALSVTDVQSAMATPLAPVTPDTTAPTAPTALGATATSPTQVNLVWTAATDNVAVTGYRIERCTGTGCTTFAQAGTSATTNFSDSGLTAGTTYTYRVLATDAAANISTASTTASVTTPNPDTTPPNPPSALTATAAGSGQINLSWTAATDNVAIAGYRIERCTGTGCTTFTQIATPTTTTYTDTGLSSATTYTYRVLATDTSNNLSTYSNTTSTTTAAAASGLVAGWSFDEGAGLSVGDVSGNTNTGTITGGTSWVPGKYGGALSFNGTTGRISVPASASLGLSSAMTLMAWVQPTANQSGWRTIMQRETDAYVLNASNDTGALRPSGGGTLGGSFQWTTSTTANPVNAWSHVALTYDGAILRLYVNGTQVATNAAAGTIQSSPDPLWIGGNSPYGEYFQGLIDEARVYNRALSVTDVQSAMATPLAPVTPDTTAPTAPTALGATATSPTQVNLVWTAATDNVAVTGYRIERCTGTGCTTFAQAGTSATTNFSDSGLTAGTTYTYRVLATDAAANISTASTTASVTTPNPDTTPPNPPSALTATAAGSGQINLSWTAATDNVAIAGYRIERCTGTGCTTFTQIATPTTTTYTDTGLSSATTYTYRVLATDTSNNLSTYSNTTSTTTADTTAPTAPTALAATAAGPTQVNLTWTASTDNVAVTGYRIERCTGATCTNFAQVGTSTTATFSNTGLAPGTAYRYRVRATDAANNNSAYSALAAATTPQAPDTTPPSAPTALTATATGQTQINLTWTASTDNVAVTGYRIERCTGAGCTNFAQVGTSTTATFSNTGLAPGTAYVYRVRATDAVSNLSTYSATATATTTDTTAPTAPTALAATAAGPTQVNLTWTASTDNVAVTGYRIERCTGATCTNFAQVGTSTTATFSNTGLTPGTAYRYRVRATDAANNNSAYSALAAATTPQAPDTTPPTAPSALAATAAGPTQVNLTWTASTDNVAVTGYRIERCTGAGCTNFAQVGTSTTATFSNTGLAPGTAYVYRVRATDAVSNLSTYSATATATTPQAPDTTPPTAPTGLTATAAGTTQINLAWTAATDNVAVTGYRIERCTGATCTNFAQVGTTAGLSAPMTGLTANTTYRFRVRATDAVSNLGPYSAIAAAETAANDTTGPTAPGALVATVNGPTSVDLTWIASTDNVGVTGYRVERCTGAGCTNYAEIAQPPTVGYSDVTVTPSTTFRYRVRAADAAGNLGTYSTVVTAATPAIPDTAPPSTPEGLTVTADGAGQLSLAWTASVDDVAVVSYTIERCLGEGCTTFAPAASSPTPSHTDGGLAAATTYSYRVSALDAAGNASPASSVVAGRTSDEVPVPAGLVAGYSFDTGSGATVADSSGNGNVGTITGATWVAGKYGGALSFNGSSARVNVPASASLDVSSSMTLMAWIQPTANQSDWRTILQRETDAFFLNASNHTGALRPSGGGTIGSGVTWVTGTTPSPVGAWTHVALTYDGSAMRLYVNGTQAASTTVTGAIQSSSSPLWIGGNNPYGEYFLGLIDEARVYDRALAPADIQAAMNTPLG